MIQFARVFFDVPKRSKETTSQKYYWKNGIASGYLKGSSLAVFIEAIIMQTNLMSHNDTIIGIPTRIIQRGIQSNIYNVIDI